MNLQRNVSNNGWEKCSDTTRRSEKIFDASTARKSSVLFSTDMYQENSVKSDQLVGVARSVSSQEKVPNVLKNGQNS